MRIELTCVGLLVYLANHYTTRGAHYNCLLWLILISFVFLYRNTKVKVRSPDGDTDYFEIVAGVLQGNTLPHTSLSSVWTACYWWNERQRFQADKGKKQKICHTITDADYADDKAFLANTSAQAKTLLHSLERAAVGIDLNVNADKTEYMCFKQRGDISTLNGSSLKLVDKFTYQESSFLSTNKDINTWLVKAWTAIDKLSVICKQDLTDKIKRSFFQAALVWILLYGCTTWTLTKSIEKKTWQQLHKNAASNIKQVLEVATHNATAVRPLTTHHKNYTS